jgi:hypothetical protein
LKRSDNVLPGSLRDFGLVRRQCRAPVGRDLAQQASAVIATGGQSLIARGHIRQHG